jgi:hypothetical protein
MRIHNPPHPGGVLKALCLEALALTVTEAAKARGVSRKMLPSVTVRFGGEQDGAVVVAGLLRE